MFMVRRIALSAMLPLREVASAPKSAALSPTIAVRWKGHSQYANKKGAILAAGMKKNKLKTLYQVHIIQAVQAKNEPDPKRNSALARVLEAVNAEQLGKEWFDAVVKKAMAKGVLHGDKELIVEVKGPAGLYGVIECVGKNVQSVCNNTIHGTLKKNMFVLMPGSAKGIFEKRGIVCVDGGDGMDFDRAEELAIESGAEEVTELDVESGRAYEFYCGHLELYGVKTKLESEGCQVLSAEAAYVPRMPVKLGAKGKAMIQSLEESLMESPNVVAFHTNVE